MRTRYFAYAAFMRESFSANRPEGRLAAEFRADEHTKEFYGRVDSSVDLRMLLPVLDSQQRKVFDIFTLTAPPKFDAELRGRLNNLESLQASGRVELTNFTFRGESFSGLQTSVEYSNRWVRFTAPRIQRGAQQMHTPAQNGARRDRQIASDPSGQPRSAGVPPPARRTAAMPVREVPSCL